MGQAAPLSAAAPADCPVLRRRCRRPGPRTLPLAPSSVRAPDHPPAARARGLEHGALHVRHLRQGLGRRLERGAAEPAQLRRHRAPVARPLSFGPHARSPVRPARADRSGSHVVDCDRRLLAWRQPDAQAGGRAGRRRARGAQGRLCGVADDGPGVLREGARTAIECHLRVELRAESQGTHATKGRRGAGCLLARRPAARADRPAVRRGVHGAASRLP